MSFEVIRTWDVPYPGADKKEIRPKTFQIVRIAESLAFVKRDPLPEYLAHESDILETLRGVRGVPSLLRRTPESIVLAHIDGSLLPVLMPHMGGFESIRIGYRIVCLIRAVHRRHIVHADIRPWNFMYDGKGSVFLIDFEYAYDCSKECRSQTLLLLRRQHGKHLKTMANDWIEAFLAIARLYEASRCRGIRTVGRSFALALAAVTRAVERAGIRMRLIRLVRLPSSPS